MRLDQSAQLFEVFLPDFKQVKQSRKEVKLLKNLWDYVNEIQCIFIDWKKTKWREINAEYMDNECKKFIYEIRFLDKEMRSWDVYTGIDNDVKNLVISLRAVTELQNPSIRDRHWQELMQITGISFVMDENTILADLLVLKLHKYEDDVKNIVEKAIKESAMDKVLQELNAIWISMTFNVELHSRTKQPLLNPSDELLELLEDNQVNK